MTACKALLVALCLSLPALAEGDAPLPLPVAPRWLHKSANGSLAVKSATRGAQVFVDGRSVGTVPLAPVPVAPGKHQLKLSKKGFVTGTRRVQVLAGQRTQVAMDLAVEVAPQTLPLPQAPAAAPPEAAPPAMAQAAPPPAAASSPPSGSAPAAGPAAPSPSDALAALIAPGPATGAGDAAARPGQPGAAPASPAASIEPPPLVFATPPVKAPAAAVAPAASTPLTKKWWFWGGSAVAAAVLVAGVTWALPALYVEHRDPTAACAGNCGIVINK